MRGGPAHAVFFPSRNEEFTRGDKRHQAATPEISSRVAAAAGFEFFAAAAGAGLVAADFRCFAADGQFELHLVLFGRGPTHPGRSVGRFSAGELVLQLLEECFEGSEVCRAAEKVGQHFAADAVHQLDKHLVGLALVFN